LAYNLWWSWDGGAEALFRRMDPQLWATSNHNPVALLRRLPRSKKERFSADRAFVAELRRTHKRMQGYLRGRSWFQQRQGTRPGGLVAYFCMEYGLHESLPIFAGGLGVLASDHLKSASDLGLPLVGIGIFWRQGYTRQRIDASGRQIDAYDRLAPENLPLIEVTHRTGRRLRLEIPIGPDNVLARAWRLEVGRTPLFLLDTHLSENAPKHRRLTDRLYSGDRDTRIRQEIVLGIGGWRLLQALDLPVSVCHLNEGHAAFCPLERLAEFVEDSGCDFREAARRVAATTFFTTHTPVPDGNETFEPTLVERYFAGYCRRVGITCDQLLALGRVDPENNGEQFGLTPLAIRLAGRSNGVSKLHGQVSRRMWRGIWPRRRVERVPIGSVTNGIHLATWLHPAMAELLEDYLPKRWRQRQDSAVVWAAARKIPDERLWQLHLELKAEMVNFIRARLRKQLARIKAPQPKLAPAGAGLDFEALTIGFARRFTTYKRANLAFTDPYRLERIVNHPERPVQFIFAGKAHPADEAGKAIVAEVIRQAREPRFNDRVVFLEDYNMETARHLVAGVDVWLNNPRRPQEASGTSGMKPTLHGGLNLSILDGWWPEACNDGVTGWSLGEGQDHDGSAEADRRDAEAFYQRLERDVVPLYYDCAPGQPPGKWIRCMKQALVTIPPAFNSHRMVKEYFRRYYLPALRRRG
jgi:starch phosphorylase